MIGAIDPTQPGAADTTAQSMFNEMGSETFLQLLITQLRYQDPASPMDATAMLQQTSQFANVEAVQRLADLQTQLTGYTQFQVAATMIGRQVSVTDAEGASLSGIVTSVRATAEGPRVRLDDGSEHPVHQITGVTELTPSTESNPSTELTPSTESSPSSDPTGGSPS